jgi:hypothetical protein
LQDFRRIATGDADLAVIMINCFEHGWIFWNLISVENFSDKFLSSNFGQISIQETTDNQIIWDNNHEF